MKVRPLLALCVTVGLVEVLYPTMAYSDSADVKAAFELYGNLSRSAEICAGHHGGREFDTASMRRASLLIFVDADDARQAAGVRQVLTDYPDQAQAWIALGEKEADGADNEESNVEARCISAANVTAGIIYRAEKRAGH